MMNEREVNQSGIPCSFQFLNNFPPTAPVSPWGGSAEGGRFPAIWKGLAACAEPGRCCVRASVHKNSEVFFS